MMCRLVLMPRTNPYTFCPGPGYRNVVGLPGGVASPYFKVLQEANVNHMELREGQGNIYERGQPKEGDEINMVWVVDSDKLPFYR